MPRMWLLTSPGLTPSARFTTGSVRRPLPCVASMRGGWTDLDLPHTTWVVAGRDRVLAPGHQRASARHCGAEMVELDVEHSMVVPAQRDLFEILDTVGCWPAEARVSL